MVHRKPPRITNGLAFTVLGATVIGTSLWLFQKYLIRAEPIGDASLKVARALVAGDSGTIAHYVSSVERDATKLDRAVIEAFCKRYCRPLASRVTVYEPIVNVHDDNSYGDVTIPARLDDGPQFPIIVVTRQDDDGPKVMVGPGLVFYAAWSSRGKPYANESETVRSWLAVRDFVKAERENLINLGMPGLFDLDASGKVISWDQLEIFADRMVRAQRRKAAHRNKPPQPSPVDR